MFDPSLVVLPASLDRVAERAFGDSPLVLGYVLRSLQGALDEMAADGPMEPIANPARRVLCLVAGVGELPRAVRRRAARRTLVHVIGLSQWCIDGAARSYCGPLPEHPDRETYDAERITFEEAVAPDGAAVAVEGLPGCAALLAAAPPDAATAQNVVAALVADQVSAQALFACGFDHVAESLDTIAGVLRGYSRPGDEPAIELLVERADRAVLGFELGWLGCHRRAYDAARVALDGSGHRARAAAEARERAHEEIADPTTAAAATLLQCLLAILEDVHQIRPGRRSS